MTIATSNQLRTDTDTASENDVCRIHFADGNKGGVGKSFFCRTLYQWFIDHQHPVTGIEADVDSPDFKGIYNQVMVAEFSEQEARMGRANAIIETAVDTKQSVVVNLPATVHKRFRHWIEDNDILTLAQDYDIELVKWFVITGEYDSCKSLEASLNRFGKSIRHIVVKNLKYPEWDFFESSESIQTLIEDSDATVICLPKLSARIASTLLQERLPFDQALDYRGKNFYITEQSALRRFMRLAYAQLETTGVLPA